jgi:hypothetical protein
MIRVVSLSIRRSTGYVQEDGELPPMSEPLDRLHTDTGLVTMYADWTVEADEAEETHSMWFVWPDGARERRGVGSGGGSHQVFLRLEEAVAGPYTVEIRDGEAQDGRLLAAVSVDIDVGF